MKDVMYWLGVGYSVLSTTALVLSALARAFPNKAFFSAAASAVGTWAADFHRMLPGGDDE